ncbi:uncharacterized protein AMSG_00431 [Thecamonas trahens ATCC 50062]|uniref:Uncharacterized protein n=1 Tax=Thecamonas trahens ATCC 50062 TaxID=461836 RepID=A0A0L0D8I9_THETB|nr:hypothetical protein AMSG_00431 [Thecamonas trahens ATCC 50062]KNC48654.1 hypothetical protein AMSG_00431 [Thecamonas trahens ATCC 50062]|eukprot:XP_013762710.1 hypothetical protein AMSG_00431 [Thecamonas trahens ATCC 50062]
MCRIDRNGCNHVFHPITLCVVLMCLPIALGVLFGSVLPNARELASYVETTCEYRNTTATSYGCCTIENCICAECTAGTATCSAMQSALTAGECCNGPHCCRTECETCCTDEAYSERYSCRCRGSTSSRRCDTCYRTRYRRVCHTCNCRCAQEVTNRHCQSVCGLCYNLATTLIVHIKRVASGAVCCRESPRFLTSRCERDRTDCRDSWLRFKADGVSQKCWYHERNPDGTLRWDRPKRNVAAVFFTVLFFVPIVAWVLATAVFVGVVAMDSCCPSTFTAHPALSASEPRHVAPALPTTSRLATRYPSSHSGSSSLTDDSGRGGSKPNKPGRRQDPSPPFAPGRRNMPTPSAPPPAYDDVAW